MKKRATKAPKPVRHIGPLKQVHVIAKEGSATALYAITIDGSLIVKSRDTLMAPWTAWRLVDTVVE